MEQLSIKDRRLLKRKTAEAKVCVRKYFKAASFSTLLLSPKTKGINIKVFNSSPNQLIKREGEEATKTIPNTRTQKKRRLTGAKIIKKLNKTT
jgi:hypothetical protein